MEAVAGSDIAHRSVSLTASRTTSRHTSRQTSRFASLPASLFASRFASRTSVALQLMLVLAASVLLLSPPQASATPLRLKAGSRAASSTHPSAAAAASGDTLQQRQSVERLIITAHPTRGGKLDAQLDRKRSDRVSQLAASALLVERRLSERSHLLTLPHPISVADARALAARLQASGEVESAEPDWLMQTQAFTPNDPAYAAVPGQWHYFAPSGINRGGANLPGAWEMTLGSGSVTVAVIDTGYRPHPDLHAMLPGYDFISSSTVALDGNGRDADATDPGDYAPAGACGSGSTATDSSWHGTHVMGTVAALMNNGLYGTGVAPHVRLLPLRVLGRCGGYTSDIVDAMRWAAGIDIAGVPRNANPARVINLSLGSSGSCSAAFQSAVNDVNARGTIVVVATGNGGYDAVNQPANCSGVVAVTAHAIDGDSADYANIGPETTISAPGGGCGTLAWTCYAGLTADGPPVYSLGNSGLSTAQADTYATKRGTSMAAPHVAGTIALILSLDPSLTRSAVISLLRSSARAWPSGTACTLPANSGLCGAGLLDARLALSSVTPVVTIPHAQQIVAPGAWVSLSGSALPPQGRSIASYAWSAAASNPQAVNLSNPQTATASFIAPANGRYAFTLVATDSAGASGNANATVRVNSVPVTVPVAEQQVNFGAALRVQLQAVDVDGDAITYHATSLPPGATLSASGMFSWTAASPVGTQQLSWYASDDAGTSLPAQLSIRVADSGQTSLAAPSGGGGGSLEGDIALMLAATGIAVVRRRRR